MKALVQFDNGVYVSSALWRIETMQDIPESQIHGPCENGILGCCEFDFAHCLQCSEWPKSALPCINRLAKAKWPSIAVLSNIVRSGFHLVPIGDKTSDKEIMEWRISFSNAETSLIDEMNHCQFLCYGLLKVFLKEAIETNDDLRGLLCSYFLKTSVLWAIIHFGTSWMTEDILRWFWICFRQLINWVYDGYCPNFFIPENNMFYGKIHGRAQLFLLNHLTTLYREGFKCLIRCSSVRGPLEVAFRRPQIGFVIPFDNIGIKLRTDLHLISDICSGYSFSLEPPDLHTTISLLECLQRKFRTPTELSAISILLKFHIQYFLICALPQWFLDMRIEGNKRICTRLCRIMNTLYKNRSDATTHGILLAILLYRKGMYQKVIKLGLNVKDRLKQSNVIYEWNLQEVKYRAAGGEFFQFDEMMKKIVSIPFRLDEGTCFPEVFLEINYSRWGIYCPPMVIVSALLYMSFHKLSSSSSEADSVLRDLSIVINNTDNHHIPCFLRAISWEMLGICQEVGGYLFDAFHSFQRALMEPIHNSFREATLIRLQMLNTRIDNL
ncbi:hypothetical protein FSP39_011839 [Pinctada imbricata]|uniref:Uncharacterized protein n=1 Tax=Pinctada imbricata TaxID=66713 RepID=A0AA88Y7I6_PINIB|nr:hypothetical protein FSP39_011839 [Pinctada imbricata]